jgi:hypothetical protein
MNYFAKELVEMERLFHKQVLIKCRIRKKGPNPDQQHCLKYPGTEHRSPINWSEGCTVL